jgi:hypothetical protein
MAEPWLGLVAAARPRGGAAHGGGGEEGREPDPVQDCKFPRLRQAAAASYPPFARRIQRFCSTLGPTASFCFACGYMRPSLAQHHGPASRVVPDTAHRAR